MSERMREIGRDLALVGAIVLAGDNDAAVEALERLSALLRAEAGVRHEGCAGPLTDDVGPRLQFRFREARWPDEQPATLILRAPQPREELRPPTGEGP